MLSTELRGARTHNLEGVDLRLEPGELIVFTGVSGAGKSSLVMDTLYAEGQRRFVESFSPYARQFLERLERPPVEKLEPIPAGVAVDRRAPVKSSRSTVATMADLEPYLSALFTREAVPFCPEHQCAAKEFDLGAVADAFLEGLPKEATAVLSFPLPVRDHEAYLEVRDSLAKEGFRRLWVRGGIRDIDNVRPSEALAASDLGVVVDRVKIAPNERRRLQQAVETAWAGGAETVEAHVGGHTLNVRRGLCCPQCAKLLEPPRAGFFSYESPLGACEACRGFGRTIGIDLDKVVPDPARPLSKRAIRPWAGKSTTWERRELKRLCGRHGVPMDVPWRKLSKVHKRLVLNGDGSWDDGNFPGVLGWFRWLETKTYKMHVRVLLARYRSYDPCKACQGQRLNERALSYRVGGLNIAEWHALEVRAVNQALSALSLREGQGQLAQRELSRRLDYLERVGLGYLSLNRQARTLSGGEAQRVTLTAALGTSLENALFVLDEPTVGLHAADVDRLTSALVDLSRRGNTVLVVEHDPAVIRVADRVVEVGPGAGIEGGRLTAQGTVKELAQSSGPTARALQGAASIVSKRRQPKGELKIFGASAHNLSDLDVKIPLGVVCAISGPSGSGKSTLAEGIVYRALARGLGKFDVERPGRFRRLSGDHKIATVALVDQAPLGRTSRGNAATYTKAWDAIRRAFAKEALAESLQLTPSHFSFNVEGGRCDACLGEGYETVEMQFLADVRLICPVCRGQRFKESVLGVKHRGLTIAELLKSTVEQVLELFSDVASINRALGPLRRLGLGYLRMGQPLSTLSGGEAQRLKLARALNEKHEGRLLILDEPSAGLHADEVTYLLQALDLIVDAGGSVVVVEHDLNVIAAADWVIDLGPGAGREGGRLVAQGKPEEVARSAGKTGRALAVRGHLPKPRSDVSSAGALETRARAVRVRGAREHNLREVSVSIPHNQLSVVTGPSGSGKSTLVFDVIFAEGQRRFLETLTPYARQYLPTMPRPDVDSVAGVPPTIALEQRTARAGAKSTVATVTEIAHYLRLLFAKLGVPHCPEHGEAIASMNEAELFGLIRSEKRRFTLLSPVVRARKGTYLDVFNAAERDGISSALCDGRRVATDAPPALSRNREHTIDLVFGDFSGSAVSQVELRRALRWGEGSIKLRFRNGREKLLSLHSACPQCGLSIPELDPRWFSFNTAQGRCPSCEGSGVVVKKKPKARRGRRAKSNNEAPKVCPECDGGRLAEIPSSVRLDGQTYPELTARSVSGALKRLGELRLKGDAKLVGDPIVEELKRRLRFLEEVGLDYLALDRAAHTLSGGELQRLRLAAQLGAGLTGALYILDEPTIGLHGRDTERLLKNLRALVNLGSTVVVVEHDADTIRAADHLVDLGPGGGERGGRILASGKPGAVLAQANSPTGHALMSPPTPREPLTVSRSAPRLHLAGVCQHNLKNVDLKLPLGRFNVVAGVSGSGKSTLIRHVLLPAVRKKLGLVAETPGRHDKLSGLGELARAVAVDQSPIGRTPRSVPATFLGLWNGIRSLFAATPEAQVAGFGAARFSFNTAAGGRCSACEGQGVTTHEMSFLPDVVTPCAVCEGMRFEAQTLEVRYRDLSIGQVLKLTAKEAADFFENHPKIAAPLKTLVDLGAGYIQLGQGSHTLSGGEAQRLKLAVELTASLRHQPTLYVLDEPTTGLHLADVDKLVQVMARLVERGDTLVVIEHHPVVMAGADWVVELGPDGGSRGGRIVAQGPPQLLVRRKTATARVLQELAAAAG